MNTLRTFIVFAILSAVGYGVYATLTHQPPPPPPEVAGQEWGDAPQVELPGTGSAMPPAGMTGFGPPTSAPMGDSAPSFGGGFPATPAGAPVPLEAGPPQSAPGFGAVAVADGYPGGAPQGNLPDAAPPFNPQGAEVPADNRYGDLGPNDPNQFPAAAAPPNDPGYPPAYPAAGPDAGAGMQAPGGPASAGDPTGADSRYASNEAHSAAPTGLDVSVAPYQEPAEGPESFDALLAQAQAQLNQGRLVDVHLELSRWYRAPQLTPQQQDQIHDLLDRLAGTVVYSQESLLEPAYEVQPGDNLERIAKLYEVPWQLLAKINGVADPQQLQPGQSLKVIRGPFHATVELESYMLTVWLGERYAGSFPIGIGQDQSTPEGTFQVLGKMENPPYHGRDVVLAADDPNNPLGERWIDLGNHVGIHGTTEAASIGQAESRGCIRLSERDVEDVYDILSVGSSVVIRR